MNGSLKNNQNLNDSDAKLFDGSDRKVASENGTTNVNQTTVTNEANLMKTIKRETKGQDIVAEIKKGLLINNNANVEETGGFSVQEEPVNEKKISLANGQRTQEIKKSDKLSSKKVAPCDSICVYSKAKNYDLEYR